MLNKHVKKPRTLLVLRERQIVTTTRWHYVSLEWFKLKRLAISSIGNNVKELELSYIAGGDVNYLTGLEKSLAVSKKLYINLSNDSVISFKRIERVYLHRDLYINIRVALFVFMCTKTWMNLQNNYVE